MRPLYSELEELCHGESLEVDDRRTILDLAHQHGKQGLHDFIRLYPERFRQFLRSYHLWRERAGRQGVQQQSYDQHRQGSMHRGYGVLDRSS